MIIHNIVIDHFINISSEVKQLMSLMSYDTISIELTRDIPTAEWTTQNNFDALLEAIKTTNVSKFNLGYVSIGDNGNDGSLWDGFTSYASSVINAISLNNHVSSIHIRSDICEFGPDLVTALSSLIIHTKTITSMSIVSARICRRIYNALGNNNTISKLTIKDCPCDYAAKGALYEYIYTTTTLKNADIYTIGQSDSLEYYLVTNRHIRYIKTCFHTSNLMNTVARIGKTLRSLENYNQIDTRWGDSVDEPLIRQLSDNYCITTCDIVPKTKKYAMQLEEILNRNRALMQEDYHADITNIVIALYPIVCRYGMDSYLITDIIDYVDGQYFEINRFRKYKLIAGIINSANRLRIM